MRGTRFIFVEGIMGAGKSTTAAFLADYINRTGGAARFVLEGPTIDEPAHPLRVATGLPHPNAPWHDVTVEEFIAMSLRTWRAFVQEARSCATITVCDGLLFHGNMTDVWLMDAELTVVRRYVAQVLAELQDLRPVVIYFRHADVAHALATIRDVRGTDWEAYQVNWKVASPYGMRRSLQGFAGLIALYRAYCAFCDDLYAHLTMPKFTLQTDGDWPTAYRRILTFLDLPPLIAEAAKP